MERMTLLILNKYIQNRMADSGKLLKLIINSVTLNHKLGGEKMEVFIEQVFDLSEEKREQLTALLEKEVIDMAAMAEQQAKLIQEYYKKLKETKIKVITSLRKSAEIDDQSKAKNECEELLRDI